MAEKIKEHEVKDHPVVLLTVYMAAMKRGDRKQAESAKAKLARRGIIVRDNYVG